MKAYTFEFLSKTFHYKCPPTVIQLHFLLNSCLIYFLFVSEHRGGGEFRGTRTQIIIMTISLNYVGCSSGL